MQKIVTHKKIKISHSENGATLVPVFKASMAFISSSVKLKSKISKFSFIRDLVTDFGMGVTPLWT